jgi:hypothetical protein
MATYETLIYNIPPYHEGNLSDFEFDLDANFPIDQVGDITFQVRKKSGELLISKTLTDEENPITLTGMLVNIPILPEDTIKRAGSYLYEIDFKNLNDEPFATIGGTFTINKQINPL